MAKRPKVKITDYIVHILRNQSRVLSEVGCTHKVTPRDILPPEELCLLEVP